MRGAEVPRGVAPGAAAQNAISALALQPRRTVVGSAMVILVPAILHPFRHVPMHVVQAEPVRFEGTHWCSLLAVPAAAATGNVHAEAVIVENHRAGAIREVVSSNPVAPAVFRRGSRTRRVTPTRIRSAGGIPLRFARIANLHTIWHRPTTR